MNWWSDKLAIPVLLDACFQTRRGWTGACAGSGFPLGGEGDPGVDAGHHSDNDRGNDATQIGISGVSVDCTNHERPDGQRVKGVSFQSGICVLLSKRPLTPVTKEYPYPASAVVGAVAELRQIHC